MISSENRMKIINVMCCDNATNLFYPRYLYFYSYILLFINFFELCFLICTHVYRLYFMQPIFINGNKAVLEVCLKNKSGHFLVK